MTTAGLENRIYDEANYILQSGDTVREIAKKFNVSKSTVHYDLSSRLKRLNYALFLKVDRVLKFNLSVRHIRGGMSTKRKYENLSKKSLKNA